MQKIIDQAPLSLPQGCQVIDAGIEVPHGTSIAEDFKNAVAEDQQAPARRNSARLSGIFDSPHYPHDQACGREQERLRLARGQNDGRRMTAAGPSQHAALAMVNPIPDREVSFAMLLALERIV